MKELIPEAQAPVPESHFPQVVKALTTGRLVIFLGAGASLSSRAAGVKWEPGQTEYLPLSGELASYLAETFDCEPTSDLARVSQQVALLNGTGPLYDELHSLFNIDYPPAPLHRFFARLPGRLRALGYPRSSDPLRRRLLVVTTNYDDLQERAFADEGVSFHTVIYEADGEQRGKFLHRQPSGAESWIERPNEYKGLFLDEQPVVLKIHGAVDRVSDERDSYVITEDHYIEYLARTDASALIPAPLPALLKNNHLLFLGYGLKDWNLRVILHRLWGDRKLTWKSWAVQLHTDPLDREFWSRRDVEILDCPLGEYIGSLEEKMRETPPDKGNA